MKSLLFSIKTYQELDICKAGYNVQNLILDDIRNCVNIQYLKVFNKHSDYYIPATKDHEN